MEIYEMTYEGILFKIKAEEEKKVCTMTRIIKFYKFCANWVNLKLKVGKKAAIPDNVDDDDALDMFADNLDGDAKKTEKVPVKDKEDPVLDDVSIFRNSRESHWNCMRHAKVSWEFKWKTEDAELHGPHTSQKMLDWQVNEWMSVPKWGWMLPLCRSPVSLMQAFLSEKLALKSSGIPRGLILSSTSSHLDLYSIPGRGEHNYYFAEVKTLFSYLILQILLPNKRAGWMPRPPLSHSCSMTGRRRSRGSRTPR